VTDHLQPHRGSLASARLLSSRRRFLGTAAVGLGTFALGPAILTSRGAVAAGGRFSQSVASGDPGTDAITLWTRADGLNGGDNVRLEVFKDSGGGGGVFDGSVPVAGGNPIAKVRVDNLEAGEQYFYRFSTGSDGSPVGRFRTARPADSNEPVRIAFWSCQEFASGYYHAHRDLANMDDIDLVVCLGDYIYEKQFDDMGVPARNDTVGEVQTIDGYRRKYNFYNADEDLLAMRAKHPMAAIWDDHEVEDNYAEMLPGGQTEMRKIPYRNRMANGYRAFFEYIPNFPAGGNNTRIYRTIRLGNAEIFLLDTRQYRDNQVCSPGDSFAAPGCPAPEYNKPGRTLLGTEQLAWLKDGLERSTATWKIVGTQVMIMSLDVGPRNPLNTDGWDGYGDERRELIDHIDRKGIKNVTFITGDIHTYFTGEVTRSGRLDGAPGSDPPPGGEDRGVIAGGVRRATEFVGGSISSRGIVDRLVQDGQADLASKVGEEQVRENNPHILFANQARKGYAIMSTGRGGSAPNGDLGVEYRAVCEVTSETNKAVDTLARFTVEEGMEEPRVTGEENINVCKPGPDVFVPIRPTAP